MPPSPIIKLTVNEQKLAQLCDELLIARENVQVKIRPKMGKFSGLHQFLPPSFHVIAIHGSHELYGEWNLQSASMEASRVLLHEMRHAWQYVHAHHIIEKSQGVQYEYQPMEMDARDFEEKRVHAYRTLMIVRRTFPGGPFKRLDATRRNVLRGV